MAGAKLETSVTLTWLRSITAMAPRAGFAAKSDRPFGASVWV